MLKENEIDKGTSREVLDVMHDFNLNAQGISFSLAMRNPDTDEITVYTREKQPCYGEMRTYSSSHGRENCTQPDDYRPSDLHNPFPDGIPEAVSIKFGQSCSDYRKRPISRELSNEFIRDVLFSPHSPWKRGFNLDSVEFTERNGLIEGVVLKDTDFDPTVLVSMLITRRILARHPYTWSYFKDYFKGSLTPNELLLLSCIFSVNCYGIPQTVSTVFIGHSLTYSICLNKLSLEKFFSGNTDDLTGGVFRDRFAYNRSKLPYIFEGDMNFTNKFFPSVYSNNIKDYLKCKELDAFIQLMKEANHEKH